MSGSKKTVRIFNSDPDHNLFVQLIGEAMATFKNAEISKSESFEDFLRISLSNVDETDIQDNVQKYGFELKMIGTHRFPIVVDDEVFTEAVCLMPFVTYEYVMFLLSKGNHATDFTNGLQITPDVGKDVCCIKGSFKDLANFETKVKGVLQLTINQSSSIPSVVSAQTSATSLTMQTKDLSNSETQTESTTSPRADWSGGSADLIQAHTQLPLTKHTITDAVLKTDIQPSTPYGNDVNRKSKSQSPVSGIAQRSNTGDEDIKRLLQTNASFNVPRDRRSTNDENDDTQNRNKSVASTRTQGADFEASVRPKIKVNSAVTSVEKPVVDQNEKTMLYPDPYSVEKAEKESSSLPVVGNVSASEDLDELKLLIGSTLTVEVKKGKITEQTIGAIVNPISDFAEEERQGYKVTPKKGFVVGDTDYNLANGLPCKFVIDVNVPGFDKKSKVDEQNLLTSLQACYTNCLGQCKYLELSSMAFKPFCLDMFDGALKISSAAAANAVMDMIQQDNMGTIKEIRFCSLDVDVTRQFSRCFYNFKSILGSDVNILWPKDFELKTKSVTSKDSASAAVDDDKNTEKQKMESVQSKSVGFLSKLKSGIFDTRNDRSKSLSDEKMDTSSFDEEKLAATAAVLNNSLSKDDECPICLIEFDSKVEKKGDVQVLSCKHRMHVNCLSDWVKKNKKAECPICKSELPAVEDCTICLMEVGKDDVATELSKCHHKFHKMCIDQWMNKNSKCPNCHIRYGEPRGNQPPGKMDISVQQRGNVPGFQERGMITINYHFFGGVQSHDHPNPGKPFAGTTRVAYLPDNEHGRIIAKLLKLAFDYGLIFTIGTSVTTGNSDVVVWNNIHHKTTLHGGAYGYPDPTYLDRVEQELRDAGVDRSMLKK